MTRVTRPLVVVVGDIVTDVLAVHDGPIAFGSDTSAGIRFTGGGAAANAAAWLASLGLAVDLAGVVGTDVAGRARLAELDAAGVGCRHVRRSGDAPTGTVIVLARGEERSMLSDRGANALLTPSDVDAALDSDVAHVHLSGYTLLDERTAPAGRHALAVARARSITTSVDAASAAPLRHLGGRTFLDWITGADLLLANLDEARALLDPLDHVGAASPDLAGVAPDDARGPSAGDLAHRLAHGLAHRLARTVGAAVVKLGPSGAVWASSDGRTVAVPAVTVAATVDPTGAGDAFAAGLLASWLADRDPANALAAAARLGALAVTTLGARPR